MAGSSDPCLGGRTTVRPMPMPAPVTISPGLMHRLMASSYKTVENGGVPLSGLFKRMEPLAVGELMAGCNIKHDGRAAGEWLCGACNKHFKLWYDYYSHFTEGEGTLEEHVMWEWVNHEG